MRGMFRFALIFISYWAWSFMVDFMVGDGATKAKTSPNFKVSVERVWTMINMDNVRMFDKGSRCHNRINAMKTSGPAVVSHAIEVRTMPSS